MAQDKNTPKSTTLHADYGTTPVAPPPPPPVPHRRRSSRHYRPPWLRTGRGRAGHGRSKPVRAALLLNYDPSGPSRLLPVIAEQEGTELKAVDMQPFLDFVKRGNLQMEFFPMGLNQCMMVLLVQRHKQWLLLISFHGTSTGELTNIY
ncbi:hypothetical protein PR202_ga11641 [Eleusine coracana subsp. coracana]|uniref:Uncharacterized protein n=1 Tax=Eleusine coracana subsp. coracana TaxID=191504 RepID=A0AAV5CA19_ELECO|nr:hypothetical protein PR202_ga11641 [Eleusine coracana subsp. coracana]